MAYRPGSAGFRRWLEKQLIPRLPGAARTWESFSRGVHVAGEEWVVRGIFFSRVRTEMRVYAYLAPLFDNFFLLDEVRSLDLAPRELAVLALPDRTSGAALAEQVVDEWHARDGDAILARGDGPARLRRPVAPPPGVTRRTGRTLATR